MTQTGEYGNTGYFTRDCHKNVSSFCKSKTFTGRIIFKPKNWNHRIAIFFLFERWGAAENVVFNLYGYVSVCLCVEGGSSENNSVALTLVDFILGIEVSIYSFDTNLSRLIKTQRVLWPISEYLLKSLLCKVCYNTTKGIFHNGMKFGRKNPTTTPWWLRQTSYVIFGII